MPSRFSWTLKLLALHLALEHLVRSDSSKVTWIDTDGSFDAARARAVLSSMASLALSLPLKAPFLISLTYAR